uniref:Protein TASOR-like n=1 Tax=Sinocyclocheilus grahami TaxID=75366 RepID=A0A672KH73_SINGR
MEHRGGKSCDSPAAPSRSQNGATEEEYGCLDSPDEERRVKSASWATKPAEEQPRLNFHIPRKSREKRALFQSVSTDSREFSDVLQILSSSYKDSSSTGTFAYSKPRLVHSEPLEKDFMEKRRELKHDGRTEKELSETFCFLLCDAQKVSVVCERGLSVGNSWMSMLGNPSKGVYLCQFSDLLQISPIEPGFTGNIIIFKVIKGKVKSVHDSMSKSMDPTPKFDSHFSKNSTRVTSLQSYRAFEYTQQYFYEYVDFEVSSRPRHLCPYAVVSFYFKGKETCTRPAFDRSLNLSCPTNCESTAVTMCVLSDTGHVIMNNGCCCFRPEKIEIGKVMSLQQVKQKIPSALFSWSLYTGSHEVSKSGMFCSLFDVVEKERTSPKSLIALLQKLEEEGLVLVNMVKDRGFLFLLSHDWFMSALHCALSKARGEPPADLSATVEQQVYDYLTHLREGKPLQRGRTDYDPKLDTREKLFPAPRKKTNWESFVRPYIYKPAMFTMLLESVKEKVEELRGQPEGAAPHNDPGKVQELLKLIQRNKKSSKGEEGDPEPAEDACALKRKLDLDAHEGSSKRQRNQPSSSKLLVVVLTMFLLFQEETAGSLSSLEAFSPCSDSGGQQRGVNLLGEKTIPWVLIPITGKLTSYDVKNSAECLIMTLQVNKYLCGKKKIPKFFPSFFLISIQMDYPEDPRFVQSPTVSTHAMPDTKDLSPPYQPDSSSTAVDLNVQTAAEVEDEEPVAPAVAIECPADGSGFDHIVDELVSGFSSEVEQLLRAKRIYYVACSSTQGSREPLQTPAVPLSNYVSNYNTPRYPGAQEDVTSSSSAAEVPSDVPDTSSSFNPCASSSSNNTFESSLTPCSPSSALPEPMTQPQHHSSLPDPDLQQTPQQMWALEQDSVNQKMQEANVPHDLHEVNGSLVAETTGAVEGQTDASIGHAHSAISSIIDQLQPEVISNLVEIIKGVQKNIVYFYIHSTDEEESDVCWEIKEYLIKLGNLECSPHGFLEKSSSQDKLLVIIQNMDIAAQVHKIPSLVSLKKHPSVSFAGVDNLSDIQNHTYNELFQSGGFIVSDEHVLSPAVITADKLQDILEYIEQLNSPQSPWRWRVHFKSHKKLREHSRLKPDALKLFEILNEYEKRHIVEILSYHDCDTPSRQAPDLDCLVDLQARFIKQRHMIFLTGALKQYDDTSVLRNSCLAVWVGLGLLACNYA